MIAASVVLVLVGLALVLAAVAALAGPWWAALAGGGVCIYAGFVASTRARKEVTDELAATPTR